MQLLEKKALKNGVSCDYEASSVLDMLALVNILPFSVGLSCYWWRWVHHPEGQAAVQREIDEVCEGRLPVLDDTPRLPVGTLQECIKETMKWSCPACRWVTLFIYPFGQLH